MWSILNTGDLSFHELPILSKSAANSVLFIICGWNNYFTSLILLLQCWQAIFLQHIVVGSTAVGMTSFVQAPGIRRLLLVMWHLKSLCQSQPSPGQHNPFHLWLTACAAPKVAVNAVCHVTLQSAQSSHADLYLPKDKQFLKCPPLCSLSVCYNRTSKSFKAICNIQRKLRSMLSWTHIMSLSESATNSYLLEEDGFDPPAVEQKFSYHNSSCQNGRNYGVCPSCPRSLSPMLMACTLAWAYTLCIILAIGFHGCGQEFYTGIFSFLHYCCCCR